MALTVLGIDISKKDFYVSLIPGIGDLTASILLAEIGDVSDYDNACQLAAYAGLTQART